MGMHIDSTTELRIAYGHSMSWSIHRPKTVEITQHLPRHQYRRRYYRGYNRGYYPRYRYGYRYGYAPYRYGYYGAPYAYAAPYPYYRRYYGPRVGFGIGPFGFGAW
jgi:hypothetical protein